MKAERRGWFVFEFRSGPSEGHYFDPRLHDVGAVCKAVAPRRAHRIWSVVKDVGVVPLCEACKARLSAA